MLLEDHKLRVARLMRGDRRVADLDRLFSDLRMSKPGRASVHEIGHFAAHRDERDTGISLARANDIQTSAKLWHRQLDGIAPSVDDMKEAARANLSIMPEERIRDKFGISRQTARQSFAKGIKKFEAGRPMKAREREVVSVLGLSMMWQFAFNDHTLSSDFADMLIAEGSLPPSHKSEFERVSQFVSLYALAIMHGARLKMADGETAQLRLAASDVEGMLRIKADIPICSMPKPITSSVPLFETSLLARVHCDPSVLTFMDPLVPVEVEGERLVAIA